MESDDRYIKASRYDIKAQTHNSQVFYRGLVAHPWRAFTFSIGMGLLGVDAAFNLVAAPRWDRFPWTGWLLGGVAFLVACYFLLCAVRGWRTPQSSSQDT